MNFYEFYNLLNENTVSQELKKLKPKIDEINKLLKINGQPIDLFDYLKKSIKEDFGVRLDDNSLNAISKWFLFIHLTWWRTHNNTLLANKAVSTDGWSKYIFRELETRIIQLRNMSNDYLAANLDQGRLNPQLISKFNDPKFKYEDLEELVNQYHENLRKGLIKIPGKPGKNILSFDDGYKWVDLEQGYCDIEGKTMGHCGNVGQRPGDTILSLRDSKNIPHLTFILNNGMLGEMKGRGNDKPAPKYYPYIIELLKSPIIKGISGGGYLPENNFKLSDLNKDQIESLKEIDWIVKLNFLDEFETWRGSNYNGNDKEMSTLIKFYNNVFDGKKLRSPEDVNTLSEDEQIMALNSEKIKYVDKKYKNKMGEKLHIIESIEAGSKYESVHQILLKQDKQKCKEPGCQDFISQLMFNPHTSENTQRELLSLVPPLFNSNGDVIASSGNVKILLGLSTKSKYKEILKLVFEKTLKIFKFQKNRKNVGRDVLYVIKTLGYNPHTPNDIKKEIEKILEDFQNI